MGDRYHLGGDVSPSAKKAPVKRGPGRPKRIDGLDSNSSAARKARGTPMISLTLPAVALETLDAIAAHLGCSRGGAIVQLVGLGVEHGYAPKTAKNILKSR